MFIQVALPVPINSVFDYTVDGILPPIGARARVPFGSRKLIGIVVAHAEQPSIAAQKLKAVLEVLDTEPLVDAPLLSLAQWLSRYYHYPLGDVLAVMLPTLLRQGAPLKTYQQIYWQPVREAVDTDFSASATKQRQQFGLFEHYYRQYLATNAPTNSTLGIPENVLLDAGIERAFLQKFADKGLISAISAPPAPTGHARLANQPHELNPEQQQAVNAIHQAIDAQVYQGFLLNGVTGSGKTEVYLQAMQRVLEQGKQVLILVPEIGLTPQTRRRFSERFVANLVMLHSGLNDTIRLAGWQACRDSSAQIIIGTRSTVLYAFANLGLIIVDEAHDGSYKQQDSLRYQATDVALYRGYQLGCPVILGTATPSLESLQLVNQAKLTELRLTARAGNAQSAPLQIIDARQQKWQYGMAQNLINAIQTTLDKDEQVLVFLNRRGYAPILLCDACGWQADCPRCDAHLTVHLQPIPMLKCHHCDWQNAIPRQCPDCGSTNLDPVGMGTSRLVEGLGVLFPEVPIIQIDRDTTRRKNSWENLYQQIADNPKAVLVGTQMVAKGHHFPNVTLVAMPNVDRGFLSADFRSPEHTAQLIIQVAGRAGREDKIGRVLIQSLQPDNPALLNLVRYGYQYFARQLLAERQLLGLPPITHACLLRVESKSLEKNTAVLQQALALLPNRATLTQSGIAVHGPIDAPMAKKNSRFHSQLLLLSQQRSTLHTLLDNWWPMVQQLSIVKTTYARLSLDIDPMGWG